MNKIKQATVIYLRGSGSAKKDEEDDEEEDGDKKKLKDQLNGKAYLFLPHPLMGVVC